MLPIPMMFNADATSVIINTCDLFISFPSVATPSTWYNASAPISSINATGSNTVVSNQYTRWYDFSGNARHLDTAYLSKYYTLGLTAGYYPNFVGGEVKRNGGNIFAGDQSAAGVVYSLGTVHYMQQTVSSLGSSPAVGTMAIVFKTAFDNTSSSYIGNHTFWIMNSAGNVGYKKTQSLVQIQGDNRSYTFSYLPNTWYVQILSVPSAGSYSFCKANDLTPTVGSYSTGGFPSVANEIRFDVYSNANNSGRNEIIAEFMYWTSSLSSADCSLVENYLKSKWCITY